MRTPYLSTRINRPLPPRKPPEYTIRQRNRRVQMTPATPTYIHTQHDPNTPAPRDTLVVSLVLTTLGQSRIRAEHHLGYRSVAEDDHDHCAAELGEGVAESEAHAVPPEVLVVFVVDFGLVNLLPVIDSTGAFVVSFVGFHSVEPLIWRRVIAAHGSVAIDVLGISVGLFSMGYDRVVVA